MATWMIEGEWSGPRNPAGNYTRVAHREYTDRQKFADAVANLRAITFTDGTQLYLTVTKRTARDGKRPVAVLGYASLIRECLLYGVARVADIPQTPEAKRDRLNVLASV